MQMSWSMILCLGVSIAVAIIVLSMIVGGLNLGGSMLTQALTTAVAVLIGLFAGRAIHARFFAGR